MSVTGTWYNELGSRMVLSLRKNGELNGTYETAVGNAIGKYKLVGKFDSKPPRLGQVLGWTVVWSNAKKNSHAVTTWSGEYQVLPGKTEQIQSMWLLTSRTKPKDNWESTLVGQDMFMRARPNAAKGRLIHMRKRAHP